MDALWELLSLTFSIFLKTVILTLGMDIVTMTLFSDGIVMVDNGEI